MKRKLTAVASSIALLAGIVVGTSSANAATIRLPKAPMQACVVQNSIYRIESVMLTTGGGVKIPLTYVPAGQAVPAQKTPSDFYAPLYKIEKGKVTWNDWWLSQYQRDLFASGKYTVMDISYLWNTANFPEQGAKYDPKTKLFDINKPLDWFTYTNQFCWDPTTQKNTTKTNADCWKGAVAFLDATNQVSFIWFNQTVAQAANQVKNFTTTADNYFVDGSELAKLQQQPVRGTTYDKAANKFGATEGLIIPIWVSQNALINGWAVAGTVATTPAAAAPAATTPTDTATAAAPLSPDTLTAVNPPAEAGRALPGRWTHPDWQGLNLGSLGYDGLYVEAKTPNEFVSSMLFADVLPTLTGSDLKPALAGQVGNKAYAISLDPDVVITVKIRVGEMKAGVTFAIGTDIVLDQKNEGQYNSITMTGTPVTVPLAKSSKDCTGETGVAKANVRQFQMLSMASNDDTSGFGVEGTSGDLYVGSNGVCQLSTPTWNAEEKTFTWQVAAPHFAPDGVTVNKGFYKAVIPVADAALLWGLTNPNDAATALEISITTEEGGSTAALKNVSVKNGKIIIDVSGFSYSRPKLKIGIKKGYKPSKATALKSTITCVMGKTTKKVTAVQPVCPKGYTKK